VSNPSTSRWESQGRGPLGASTVYGVALAALAAALLLRLALDPIMGSTLPLVTMFGAVALATWAGGFRPGILVTVVGYVASTYLFIDPRGTLGLGEARHVVGLLTYLATCGVIIGLAEATRRAQTSLTEASRRKDEFLATLSHELRNPLAPIRNAVEVMKRARGDTTVLERSADLIDRQITQLARLTDDLLDVSRISRGRLELRRENVALTSLLSQVAQDFRPLAAERGHTLSLSLPGSPVAMDGDAARLAQLFGNLLDNAFKYTPDGGNVSLSLETGVGSVVVSVKDDGIGIPADVKCRIFEMFIQAGTPFDRASGGLGIGLALVRQIAELHGGEVDVVSSGPGTGSEFLVRLPARIGAIEVPPAVAPAPRVTPRRILVVDDNEDSAATLAELLRLDGHEIATAYDGLEAVEEARRFRPAVILLDIGLPKLNGFGVCQRIRKEQWGKSTQIIAVTGWGHAEARRESVAAGFDSHLVKPVDYATLTQLIASTPLVA
jgi:signal transduction histidine kinase